MSRLWTVHFLSPPERGATVFSWISKVTMAFLNDGELKLAIEKARGVFDQHEMASVSGQYMALAIFDLAERAGVLKVCDRCSLDGLIEQCDACPECDGQGFRYTAQELVTVSAEGDDGLPLQTT